MVSAGEYGKAATSFVTELSGAAPSMLISRIPGGYALLGGSSFTEKLNTDLIERTDQDYPETDLGTDFTWGATFKFLRDDLLNKMEDFNSDFDPTNYQYGANLVPEVGDIIMYQDGYYEVDSTNANQYFMGKNPDYPNNINPINPGLEDFGSSISIICETHYVPADKLGITQERLYTGNNGR